MKYESIHKDLVSREHSKDNAIYGIKRFIVGLAKKVLIANTLSIAVNQIWNTGMETIGTTIAWFGVFAYALQIYYDFSGYSDMAIGIGKIFGFSIIENFNYPYVSLSIQEFWRRWHISLSTWFKNYIYIPLGGNRNGLLRTLINLFIVFFTTGIWHGASLNFIVWGMYFAFFSIIERLFLGKLLKNNKLKILNWLYAILVVCLGWVLFRSENLLSALNYYRYLFIYHEATNGYHILRFMNANTYFALIAGLVFIFPVARKISNKFEKSKLYNCFVSLLLIVIFIITIVFIVNGSYSPSIYASF